MIKLGNPFFNPPIDRINGYSDRSYIAWVGLFQYQKNLKLLFELALHIKTENFKIAGVELFTDVDQETSFI